MARSGLFFMAAFLCFVLLYSGTAEAAPSITEWYAGDYSLTSPQGITSSGSGLSGKLWIAAYNYIGQMTPDGTMASYLIPTTGPRPIGIIEGPDGNIWFAESSTNKIGKITPAGDITEFAVPLPTYDPGNMDIAAGSDGALWFTYYSNIGRITTAGIITEYPLSLGSQPRSLSDLK